MALRMAITMRVTDRIRGHCHGRIGPKSSMIGSEGAELAALLLGDPNRFPSTSDGKRDVVNLRWALPTGLIFLRGLFFLSRFAPCPMSVGAGLRFSGSGGPVPLEHADWSGSPEIFLAAHGAGYSPAPCGKP
jgi:hypothetical protein